MNAVERAFRAINRKNFVPNSLTDQADIDMPLPIGYGQTISQPSTVLSMLEWLDAQPNDKVLDVGSGSGWTSALLSLIVKPKGKIFAVEKIPQLVELGKNNCHNAGIYDVTFFQAGSEYGLPNHAPYDRILVSASAKQLPSELVEQLKNGGKLIIPVRNDIIEITKTSKQNYKSVVHPGYIFVPLV